MVDSQVRQRPEVPREGQHQEEPGVLPAVPVSPGPPQSAGGAPARHHQASQGGLSLHQVREEGERVPKAILVGGFGQNNLPKSPLKGGETIRCFTSEAEEA